MKEYELINLIKSIVDDKLNIIGNDTAVIKDSGLTLTCDTLVEDVHFRVNTTNAYDLGYKSGAVNLSDIAASGGICEYFLVSLALPHRISTDFVRDFYYGLKNIAGKFGTYIVGGDLTTCEKIVITITAIGKTKVDTSRSYANIGQKLITTGDYGASFTGLMLLEKKNLNLSDKLTNTCIQQIIDRHLKPLPRINEAQFLINNLKYDKYCMMDTSDGLADAVYQIAQKSEKKLRIYINKIPVDNNVKLIAESNNISPENIALYGGEDFELLFAINQNDLLSVTINNEFKFTEIGEIIEGNKGVDLVYSNKIINLTEEILDKNISFKHF